MQSKLKRKLSEAQEVSAKRKREGGGSGEVYFIIPGACIATSASALERDALPLIRDLIHPSYAQPCKPSSPWIPLEPLASFRAAVLGLKYLGLPLRGGNRNCKINIRTSTCDAVQGKKECRKRSCICRDNRLYLAPTRVGKTNEWVYGFANCNSTLSEALVPPKGVALLTVDKACAVQKSVIVKPPKGMMSEVIELE